DGTRRPTAGGCGHADGHPGRPTGGRGRGGPRGHARTGCDWTRLGPGRGDGLAELIAEGHAGRLVDPQLPTPPPGPCPQGLTSRSVGPGGWAAPRAADHGRGDSAAPSTHRPSRALLALLFPD